MDKETQNDNDNIGKFDFNDALFICGSLSIVGGVFFINPPYSLIVLGIILIFQAFTGGAQVGVYDKTESEKRN